MAPALALSLLLGCEPAAPAPEVAADADVGDKADDPSFHPGGTVALDAAGFRIDGRRVLLRGGTIQWFKLPPETWDDRLRRFKAAGYNTVDVYVAWRNHEPAQGRYDFRTHDLRRFLQLCQAHGLYVYLRPGPYITNEMDGGGVPAWVFARSSKRSRDAAVADGTMNLRTNDRDYLDAVGRYLGALDEVVRPFLYTNGGPIILYAVENEYDWFLQAFELDKLAELAGAPERPADQVPDVAGYLTALRDRVRADGIDIPVTTCPGDGSARATGDVPGIAPMPNVYGPLDHAEYNGFQLLGDLHDAARHGGVYRETPGGVTETDRPATTLRRLVMGGMDAVFQFNALGSAAEGRQNAVVMNGGAVSSLAQVLDVLRKIAAPTPGTGFVRAPIGYFHNVLDYGGPVGPSGTLRPSFHDLRRTNLFFSSFEGLIGAAERPRRSTDSWVTAGLAGLDQRVRVRSGEVGTQDPDATYRRISYWLPLQGDAALLSLYHDGARARTLGPGTIEAFGDRFPRFSTVTVPVEASAPSAGAGRATEYAQLVPIRFPLRGVRLTYSTSEVLTYRAFGDEMLLVVYGPPGSEGELRLDAPGLRVVSREVGVVVHEERAGALTLGWRHGAPQGVVVEAGGVRTRIVVLDTASAGRTWFSRAADGAPVVLVGPTYFEERGRELGLFVEPGADATIVTLSPRAIALHGLSATAAHDAGTLRTSWRVPAAAAPTVAVSLGNGRARQDQAEAAPGFPVDGWEPLGDAPDELERHGILEGHAWYRASVDLTAAQAAAGGPLWIDSVSDLASIYVNGRYLLTVAPLGTEVSSSSDDPDYHFELPAGLLRAGRNELAVRVEVWGHGSFMFPRGTVRKVPVPGVGPIDVPGLRVRLPAVGFDGVKGVIGQARLASAPVRDWHVRAGLGGELAGLAAPGVDRTGWSAASVPLVASAGGVTWYHTRFRGDALPDPARSFSPAVLHLEGQRVHASLYVNGRLIGRWLSDEGWLRRGSWARPYRDAWMNTPPDDFPLPREMLADGDNDLVVVLEDASDATRGEAPGRIDVLDLRDARENRARTADGTLGPVMAPLDGVTTWME